MLERLERTGRDPEPPPEHDQLALFTPPAPARADPVRERLADLDPDGLTPREALDALYALKRLSES